jgi:predicted HNH restriction endonuclease
MTSSIDVDMILKQKENKNRTTWYGLMGVCSNCHSKKK